jgi:hypothetical protein
MPLDNQMNSPELYDQLFYDRAVWYTRFSWRPRRCALTGKLLWLTWAYQGTAMWTGPSALVYECKWVERGEFLFRRLKGLI